MPKKDTTKAGFSAAEVNKALAKQMPGYRLAPDAPDIDAPPVLPEQVSRAVAVMKKKVALAKSKVKGDGTSKRKVARKAAKSDDGIDADFVQIEAAGAVPDAAGTPRKAVLLRRDKSTGEVKVAAMQG